MNPNDGKVLSLFGKYVGTVRDQGLWWANPFYSKKRVSLRVRNFETTKLKVNDSHSNPIEIGAIIVWKVVDTAEALFEVDDYQAYGEQSPGGPLLGSRSHAGGEHRDDLPVGRERSDGRA